MNFDAWRHTLRGRLMQFLRRRTDAIASYRAALAADPGATRAAHALAFLLAQDQHYPEAITILQLVVERRPTHAVAWFNLGYLYDKLDRLDEATEAFRTTVLHKPKLDRAWYGLGLTLTRAGKHREAAEAHEQSAKLQPMNGHAWYQLAMTYHTLDEAEKVKGIVEYLDRFDRHMARKLILDSGRSDLAHIVKDLRQVGQNAVKPNNLD